MTSSNQRSYTRRTGAIAWRSLLGGVSAVSIAAAMPAHAQDADAESEARQDVVVVTGIRSSLEEAMDMQI